MYLCVEVAAFEDDESVGDGIAVAVVNILAHKFDEVRKGHDGS